MTKLELVRAVDGLPDDTEVFVGGTDVSIVVLAKEGVVIDDDVSPFVDEEDRLLPGLRLLWPPAKGV